MSALSGSALSTDSEEFLSWLAVERGRAANTIAAYRRDLASYEEFLQGRGLGVAQVTEGLQNGDKVIVGNVGTLGRGMQVTIAGTERPQARKP